MRWSQLFCVSGGLLTGLLGWAGNVATEMPTAYPRGPDFYQRASQKVSDGPAHRPAFFGGKQIAPDLADGLISPLTVAVLTGLENKTRSYPVWCSRHPGFS